MAKTVELKGKMSWSNSELKKGFKEATGAAKKFGSVLKGAAGLAGGVAITATISKNLSLAAEKFDRIGKLSKQFGASTGFLQNVAKASELAGVNLESVAKIQRNLIVNTREGARGIKTYADAFADLGVSVEDFQKLSPDEQFAAFSKAIASAGDNQTALAAAIKLGGRATADALPLLKDYKTVSEAINKTPAVSEEHIKNIEKLNDAWTSMKATMVDWAAVSLSKIQTVREQVGLLLNDSISLNNALMNMFGGGDKIAARGSALRTSPKSMSGRNVPAVALNKAGGTGGGFAIFGAVAAAMAAGIQDRNIPTLLRNTGNNLSVFDQFGGTPPSSIFDRFGNGTNISAAVRGRRAPRRMIDSRGGTPMGFGGSGLRPFGEMAPSVQGARGGLSGPTAFRSKREALERARWAARRDQQENKTEKDLLGDIEDNTKRMADALEPTGG